MPSAFRQIADELNPDYVPEWALEHRRPVPGYATRLLSTFGPYWLPRFGLTIQLVGSIAIIAALVAAAAREWAIAMGLFFLSVVVVLAGALMWQSYRMRHWLPTGAASTAPLTAPVRVPVSTWIWMVLAVVGVLGGTALWIWILTSGHSIRAIVFGAATFSLCAATSSSVLLKQVDGISRQKITFLGMTRSRFAGVTLLVGLGFALTLFLQLPFLQGSLLPGT